MAGLGPIGIRISSGRREEHVTLFLVMARIVRATCRGTVLAQ
jgi:hypothetical protein